MIETILTLTEVKKRLAELREPLRMPYEDDIMEWQALLDHKHALEAE